MKPRKMKRKKERIREKKAEVKKEREREIRKWAVFVGLRTFIWVQLRFIEQVFF